jgi:hypothetical protein
LDKTPVNGAMEEPLKIGDMVCFVRESDLPMKLIGIERNEGLVSWVDAAEHYHAMEVPIGFLKRVEATGESKG